LFVSVFTSAIPPILHATVCFSAGDNTTQALIGIVFEERLNGGITMGNVMSWWVEFVLSISECY